MGLCSPYSEPIESEEAPPDGVVCVDAKGAVIKVGDTVSHAKIVFVVKAIAYMEYSSGIEAELFGSPGFKVDDTDDASEGVWADSCIKLDK